MAYMDYMDPDVLCPQKADKLNLSLCFYSCCARVAAQTTPVQTVLWSISIANHSQAFC